jgi:type II secretory pathway pseudopilin PulG
MKTKIFFRSNAFTLVEVMVSTAVLSFIILMLAQMIAMVSQAWSEGVERVDNFTTSRATLDVVASDLQHAVIRPDLPIFQINGIFNATMGGFGGGTYSASFFTGVPGISAASVRDISCVSYGVVTTTDADKIKLRRSDLAVPWNDGSNIPFQGNLNTPLGNVTARDMAPGVVGFEFTFRRADGTVSTTYTGYNSTDPVVAVGVTIAVVGTPALTQLSTANLTSIQSSLVNYVTSASSITSVKALWDSKLTSGFFAPYPKELGSNLKTFERWVVPPQPF